MTDNNNSKTKKTNENESNDDKCSTPRRKVLTWDLDYDNGGASVVLAARHGSFGFSLGGCVCVWGGGGEGGLGFDSSRHWFW